jgi:hypothetical protein
MPDWPRYAPAGEQYLEFGKDIRTGAFGLAPRLDMIRDYYASQRGAQVQGLTAVALLSRRQTSWPL